MNEDANLRDQIPPPVHLNLWKHHAGFIGHKIAQAQQHGIEILFPYIQYIGNTQMDLYTGSLNPTAISKEILEQLREAEVTNYEAYRKWLQLTPKRYRILELSDNSRWTMLLGYETSRFVHIHPARYSAHSIRVRGLTLKTAITVLAYKWNDLDRALQLEVVNTVRQELLQEPPLKRLHSAKGIGKMIKKLYFLAIT